MKILVTGSNGLLGQKIIYGIKQLNSGKNPIGNCQWPKVTPIDIVAISKGPNRLIDKEGYTYADIDISNWDQVELILKGEQPDVIINTAAMTNVDACESSKDECWASNVMSVSFLVQTAEKLVKKPHFIHLSTDFIFDGENGPYTEDDIPNPLSYYALSKHKSEIIVRESTLPWSIIRTIIVYGIVDNMSRSNVVLWAKDALSKGQKINVVDDQFRAPTLAEDLAQGCLLTALKGETGIFNVAGKDIMSVLELVTRVAKFWNLDETLINPIKSETLNQAAKRPPRTGFVLDKSYKVLGYTPHSFEEGLRILDNQLPKN